jgi:hypothetical protein
LPAPIISDTPSKPTRESRRPPGEPEYDFRPSETQLQAARSKTRLTAELRTRADIFGAHLLQQSKQIAAFPRNSPLRLPDAVSHFKVMNGEVAMCLLKLISLMSHGRVELAATGLAVSLAGLFLETQNNQNNSMEALCNQL